jgi:hypothetical protein
MPRIGSLSCPPTSFYMCLRTSFYMGLLCVLCTTNNKFSKHWWHVSALDSLIVFFLVYLHSASLHVINCACTVQYYAEHA